MQKKALFPSLKWITKLMPTTDVYLLVLPTVYGPPSQQRPTLCAQLPQTKFPKYPYSSPQSHHRFRHHNHQRSRGIFVISATLGGCLSPFSRFRTPPQSFVCMYVCVDVWRPPQRHFTLRVCVAFPLFIYPFRVVPVADTSLGSPLLYDARRNPNSPIPR